MPAQKRLLPSSVTGQRFRSSPPPIGSKRITSAPSCARVIPPRGAATKAEPSTTRMPVQNSHRREPLSPQAINPTKLQSSTSSDLTAPEAVGLHPSTQVHQAPAPVERMRPLDAEVGREDVALEHRSEVVATTPGDDRDQIRNRSRGLRCGDRDRVAAVDEPAPMRARPGSVCALARFSVSRASSGAELTVSRPSTSNVVPDREVGEVRPRNALSEAVEPPTAGDGGGNPLRVELVGNLLEAVGVSGLCRRVPQGDHRAAPEVEHRLAALVLRSDPQGHQSARSAVRPWLGSASAQRPRFAFAACRRCELVAAAPNRGRRGCRAHAGSARSIDRWRRHRRGSDAPARCPLPSPRRSARRRAAVSTCLRAAPDGGQHGRG